MTDAKKELTCFVIIPSNRERKGVQLIPDDRLGLVERPSGCQDPGKHVVSLDFDDVYELIIKRAIDQVNQDRDRKLHINCIRGQDLFESGDIVLQMIRHICTADITITDITTFNPNVFLEYGIRLSVKDSLNIMICYEPDKDKLPFDIRRLRYIGYAMDVKTAGKAKDTIASSILENFDPPDGSMAGEGSDLYKRTVDLYTGRRLERRRLTALQKAPELIADLACFFFAKEEKDGLEEGLLEFFDSLGEVLEKDNPGGQLPAIEHYDRVSRIKGLPPAVQKKMYLKLAKICDTVPDLKAKGEEYLKAYKRLKEK